MFYWTDSHYTILKTFILILILNHLPECIYKMLTNKISYPYFFSLWYIYCELMRYFRCYDMDAYFTNPPTTTKLCYIKFCNNFQVLNIKYQNIIAIQQGKQRGTSTIFFKQTMCMFKGWRTIWFQHYLTIFLKM